MSPEKATLGVGRNAGASSHRSSPSHRPDTTARLACRALVNVAAVHGLDAIILQLERGPLGLTPDTSVYSISTGARSPATPRPSSNSKRLLHSPGKARGGRRAVTLLCDSDRYTDSADDEVQTPLPFEGIRVEHAAPCGRLLIDPLPPPRRRTVPSG
jgi:hypothetical protein